jgi:adenylate kinase
VATVSARRYSLLGGPDVDTYSFAEILAHSAGLTAVSLGNLCRSNVQRVTSLGRRMATFVDAGELIPDYLLLEVMIDHLSTLDGG